MRTRPVTIRVNQVALEAWLNAGKKRSGVSQQSGVGEARQPSQISQRKTDKSIER